MKLLENTARWRKTKRGLVTNLFHKMKSRNEITLSLNDLHSFSNCKKFDRLFLEWEKSGYNKQLKPSIDRINNKKGYNIDNIQWLTWAENRFKQSMERRNRSPKVAQKLNGIIIKTYQSQRQVVKTLGISQGSLSLALNGKRKYCYGYEWEYIYENPELLK